MARARACGGRHLRRHVRLHPPGRRIENELRNRRAAFERHVHEPIARIGADLMRHRADTEFRVSTAAPGARRRRSESTRSSPASAGRRSSPTSKPAARPVGGEMRGDAARRRHVVDGRQRSGCLIDRKRPHAPRVGLVHGEQKFRRRIERQERRVLADVGRLAGRHELAAAVSSRKIAISGR